MPQPFIQQLEQVCRSRQRRRWLTATCWALVTALVVALALIGLDRLLGIADPIGRTLWTLAFLASCVWVARRWWLSVTSLAVTPLEIAHEVEHRHPQLRDVVASAWEFSQQAGEDPTAGSESLRRAVVLRAATAVDDIDWQQMVPRRQLRQAVLALASIGCVLGVLGWFLPAALGIGVTRLINPLSVAEWPREHDLHFIEPPSLLAGGEDLVLQLEDTRGALPDSITMHYRVRRQGRWHEESQTLTTALAPFEIRRPNVLESLEYRVTGADHQTMPWQELKVLAPPRIDSLQVTVHPPDYTKLPIQSWEQNTPIYAGSEIELQGYTDQTVTKVAAVNSQGESTDAKIGSTEHSFEIVLPRQQITQNDTYSLHLTTPTGLLVRSETELALQVHVDQPPEVRFVEPAADLTVLSQATVPLTIAVNDELALREIDLVYSRSDRSEEGEQRIPLWSSELAGDSAVKQQRVEYLWELQSLSLQPGSLIEVRAQASDAQPAVGQTRRTLQLRIVSADQLWREIMDQQSDVAETLAQLLRSQRELRAVTTDWMGFPKWSTARWANASHATLFRQRQIVDALVNGERSVIGQLDAIAKTIERNQLLRPEAVDRLQRGRNLLQSLVEGPLSDSEASLSEIVRLVQRSFEQEKLTPRFSEILEQQGQSVAGLQQAINLLLPGNLLGRLERELTDLQTDQAALAAYCRSEIVPKLLQSDIDAAEESDLLSGVVRRQREMASRLTELMLEMSQTSARIADEEPTLSVRLSETVQLAEELRLQSTIQSAADQLARRRLGRAASSQQQTLDGLSKLLARLAGRDTEGAAQRIERLQAAERKLERLRREVASLEKKLRQLNPQQRDLERLRRQQEALAAETDELTRQLEKLSLPQAAQQTKQAASQLRQAKLDRETTKQAKRNLDQAQQQLTAERRRQQVALARLQMAQLDTKLKALLGRQQAIQREVIRLENVREQTGELNAAQRQSVRQLTGLQLDLRDEVTIQADELVSLPVFAHLLKVAAETMQQVEAQLQQTKLGQPTQALVEQAVIQLTQLAEAVRQEQQNLADNAREGGGGQGEGGDKAQQQTLQLALGQLQLLKSLQSTLRAKTQKMETQLAAGEQADYSAAELARQQAQLTELARQLMPEPPDPPTEDLFPDLEQELERSFEEPFLPNFDEVNRP